ncbi:unnamed protein product [Rotaria socialis]|uniref:Syntaxin 17 n=1 Tax=Rotaria socialis TaxID=392032 RepID=A0A820W586_9BILA|nr:unnamed protein product [Rotaria socialis]
MQLIYDNLAKDEIHTISHNLAKHIAIIEQLHSQSNENQRLKLAHHIHLLRIKIGGQMTSLDRLQEELLFSSLTENNSSLNEIDQNDSQHSPTSNEFRHRQITTNRLNDSYDLLEQDLAYLHEAIDEVNTIIKQQNQKLLSKTEHVQNNAEDPSHNTSSLIQKVMQSRYFALVSGAVIGASLGGPVGFMVGAKVGALVTLSGSAVGALSLNIMRQKVLDNNESQNNDCATYNQAML